LKDFRGGYTGLPIIGWWKWIKGRKGAKEQGIKGAREQVKRSDDPAIDEVIMKRESKGRRDKRSKGGR